MVATAQMIGGIVAAAILAGLTPGKLSVSVALGQGTSRTQGMFIEMFTTAALVLSVLMLAAGGFVYWELLMPEKHNLTPFAPLGFGLILFVGILFSCQFTGGAVNTARAFGPACFEGFPNYHWIYCEYSRKVELTDRVGSDFGFVAVHRVLHVSQKDPLLVSLKMEGLC